MSYMGPMVGARGGAPLVGCWPCMYGVLGPMVVDVCNPTTWEGEARGQKYEFVLSYIEFQASMGYLSLKTKVGECESDVLLNVDSQVESTKMET